MSTIYGTQLEPFEENQSPSPNETPDNPYETTLAIRPSSLPKRRGSGPPSPINTVNTLHRQLSGDPESPPPAWKRRPTVSNRQSRSPPRSESSPTDPSSPVQTQTQTQRSPSQTSVKSRNSGYRRPPPGLTMTSSSPKPAVPLPNGMFLHESPNSSSTNLAGSGEIDLALPNPAFRRRANGNGSSSNRSSIASHQDLGSLTSEELWALGHGQEQDITPDMSNPMRQAAERPLDTVRRESRRIDKDRTFTSGLPGDVIWPSAPPVEEILPDARSKSFTNVATLGMSGRRMSRRTKSRQSSIDVSAMSAKEVDGLYMHNASQPASPTVNGMGVLSSAHSSSTSLASQALPPNKSFSSLGGRPPSTYYSRDFLSSLAPREGGYAIAAQMGGGLGAVGTMSVEEKRRSNSMYVDDGRSRTMGSRAPPSKSAGMGRWSLDGGENFGRPYGTASAATTSSNLSAPPINSAEPSPPAEEITSSLPAGASPAYTSSGPSVPLSTTPPNPSPLAQHTSAEDAPVRKPPTTSAPPPIPASNVAPPPALATKKSKKQLAKENKAAEKEAAMKVARQRAEAARAEALKKQAEREEAKRKEKEEKARKKAEKKAAKKGKKFLGIPGTGSTSNSVSTGSGSSTPHPPPAPQRVQSNTPIAAQYPSPTPTPKPAVFDNTPTPTSGTPFPKPMQSSQSAYKVPMRDTTETPRPTHKSMPLNVAAPKPTPTQQNQGVPPAPVRPGMEGKRSLFGTIRKRFSYIAGSEPRVPQVKDTAIPPVPKTPTSAVTSQTPKTQPNGVLPSPPPTTESTLPPRRESLVASSSIAKVSSPTPIDSPQQPLPQTPVLGKTISREATTSSPPPSAGTKKRNSLHGPRPMPSTANGGSPRPSSVATHESSSGGLDHQHTQGQGIHQGGQITPTPSSTTNDSSSFFLQSHNSHMTSITPITSPEDNDSFDPQLTGEEEGEGEPVKKGSADSNETVHVGSGVATSAGQPILA
ncbi:hypothetical protein I302_106531 [Kwoniella bestiolae CBS 10118]|uniref:Uncharacterized protein n=1 Tax=Kwoniella bestiolae CBS 10118 TaxID=1296100 RepID=A0AAJ8KC07_9TREE